MPNISELSLNEEIKSAVKEYIGHLKKAIKYEKYKAKTNRVLIVYGWDNDQNTLNAMAKYLVGLRATAIDVALNTCSILVDDTPEGKIDVLTLQNDVLCKIRRWTGYTTGSVNLYKKNNMIPSF